MWISSLPSSCSLHGCLRAVLDIFYALTCCAVRRKACTRERCRNPIMLQFFFLLIHVFSHIFSPVVSHPLTGICSIQSPLQVSQFSGRARAHVALAGGDLFWGPLMAERSARGETSKRRDEGTKETSCNILLFYDDDNKYIGITPKAGIVFWSFFFLRCFFFVFKAMLLLLFFTPGPIERPERALCRRHQAKKTLFFSCVIF